MKMIFMAHPVAGDVEENLGRAKRWVKWIEDTLNVVVAATWIVECQIYDDSDPERRAASFKRNFEVLKRCDEFWMVGPYISKGMAEEMEFAQDHEMRVVDFTFLGRFEPPKEIPEELQEELGHSIVDALSA